MSYYSAEQTWDIGYSLYNLITLKVMFDHGYDVDGVEFWCEANTTGIEGDNMLEVVLERVFEVEKRLEDDAGTFGYGFYVTMPVHAKIREYVNTSLNEKEQVTHFLDWFEEKFISLLQEGCLDCSTDFLPFGRIFFSMEMWANDMCWAVERLILLKHKADKYLEFLEKRSDKQWQTLQSA